MFPNAPIQEVQKKARISPLTILLGLCVFGALLLMLMGTVRLYELKEQQREYQEELSDKQDTISELENQLHEAGDLRSRAEKLGLTEPDPTKTIVVHIRK